MIRGDNPGPYQPFKASYRGEETIRSYIVLILESLSSRIFLPTNSIGSRSHWGLDLPLGIETIQHSFLLNSVFQIASRVEQGSLLVILNSQPADRMFACAVEERDDSLYNSARVNCHQFRSIGPNQLKKESSEQINPGTINRATAFKVW